MTSDAAADATTRANCLEEVASIMTNTGPPTMSWQTTRGPICT